MSVPVGLKATSAPKVRGVVAGLAYLVPKPADQGYTEMRGKLEWDTAIAVPAGLKATLFASPVGNVAGLVYLVPKPAFHG